jgi:hypothetical protein
MTMTSTHDDPSIAALFAPLRALEPTDDEVRTALARLEPAAARQPVARRLRLAIAATAALALVLGTGYIAAPPVRAAIDDIADVFSGWLGGDTGAAPGRPLGSAEDAPAYFRDSSLVEDPRVIAEADGYKLFAYREAEGTLGFDLGNTGYGTGGIRATDFSDHAIYVLGPGAVEHADEHGHVPLFGITARTVRTVELTYASGPPLRVTGVSGGFVLLAEPPRSPIAVVGYDGTDREIERVPVDNSKHEGSRIDWSRFGPPAPRVPAECLPGAVGNTPPPSCPNANG